MSQLFELAFLFDIPNFFICVVTVIFVSNWAKLPANYRIILIGHCLVPFFLNDVLIPISLIPDQSSYTTTVQGIRGEWWDYSGENHISIIASSWMLSAIPLPYVETIQSLGFFNKFLFIVLFGFLYKKQILNSYSAYFFLLYPSFVFYSALSLRDMLIFLCMILVTYHSVKRNFLRAIIWMAPLLLIKPQNFLLISPLLLYLIFNLSKHGLSVRSAIISISVGFGALLSLFSFAIPFINYYRVALYREDGGQSIHDIELINNVSDLIYMGLKNGFYFIFKPFPWEANNLVQLIQSIENIAVLYLIVMLSWVAYKTNVRQFTFWVALFIFSMSIYGLVVFNFGTAARYRFPFILIYIIFVCYSCGVNPLNKKTKSL